jgi:hypothetical protein
MTTQTTNSTRLTTTTRDVSGFAIFSAGDMGEAHVIAHQMFDKSRFEDGHRRLGDWLATRTGSGSDWMHLQFHMALFELTVDRWDDAYTRFTNEILPVAETTNDALTDAPALAWQLALAAQHEAAIDWGALRRTALRNLGQPATPFVELHHLLAFAGANDVDTIERWLSANRLPQIGSLATTVLTNMASALSAWCRSEYRAAAAALAKTVPRIQLIGGSHAQQQLFIELERVARHRADGPATAERFLAAA